MHHYPLYAAVDAPLSTEVYIMYSSLRCIQYPLMELHVHCANVNPHLLYVALYELLFSSRSCTTVHSSIRHHQIYEAEDVSPSNLKTVVIPPSS